MSNNKCFCHFNGYEVKDATARKNIETLKEDFKNLKISPFYDMPGNVAELHYHNLGRLKFPRAGGVVVLNVFSGDGYNGIPAQNGRLVITIKRGADDTMDKENLLNVFGTSVEIFGPRNNFSQYVKVFISAVDVSHADIWLYVPNKYHISHYYLQGNFSSFEKSEVFSELEPSENLQKVSYVDCSVLETYRN